jgi:hypothetical protein
MNQPNSLLGGFPRGVPAKPCGRPKNSEVSQEGAPLRYASPREFVASFAPSAS